MVVERITSQINLENNDRFLIFYGANTNDSFCTANLQLQDIEQVLHQYLQSLGFQRILFYGGNGNLYFLDRESKNLALPPTETQTAINNNQEMRTASDAPLSRKRRLLRKRKKLSSVTVNTSSNTTNNNNNQPANIQNQRRYVPDIECLSIFDHFMKDTQYKSAIIFSNAEDLSQFTARRQLTNKMVEWARLLPTNLNRCLLICHHRNQEELQRFCEGFGLTLTSSLMDNQSRQHNSHLVSLLPPSASELTALQNYFRLEHNKLINWNDFDKLSRWLTAENKPLDYWYHQFQLATELSVTEAKKLGWLSGDVHHESALKRLNTMIGLNSVKNAIKIRMESLQVAKARLEQGIITKPPRLHLIFKGNPGTGKTTVAKLIGEIYRDNGFLKRGHVNIVSRDKLVASYVGQTAIKTSQEIDNSIDGVLFIDEAYSLVQNEGDSFGQEAIDTLTNRILEEEYRLAVILAGYPAQIDRLLKANAGLKSRFNQEIIFEDYQPEELMAIFKQKLTQIKGIMTSELETNLLNLFTNIYNDRDEDFGNAREVENLFNNIDNCRSSRISQQKLDPIQEPFQITDIPLNYQELAQRKSKVKQQTNTSKTISKEYLFNYLSQRIIGQKNAIKTLIQRTLGKLKAKYNYKPLVILLPGPTGTGKTEIGKALAEALGTQLIRFDMGEYAQEYKASNLFGSARGYVGASDGGMLPNAIRKQQKRCVILFDEVEKAHHSLWQQLLAFFDEGRIKDTQGQVIAPKETICLLTTNLQAEKIGNAPPEKAKDIIKATGVFSPEFLGRIEKVIPMGKLNQEELSQLILVLVQRLAENYLDELTVTPEALAILVQETRIIANEYGGRGINEKLSDILLDDLIELETNKGILDVNNQKLVFSPQHNTISLRK